jgi:hypothetical protein
MTPLATALSRGRFWRLGPSVRANRNVEFGRALRAKSGDWRIFESAFSTSAREPAGALDAKSCALRILR